MRPLRDNLFIRIDESLPNQVGILLPVNVDKWRDAKDQIANRGTVVQIGEGRRHPKTGHLAAPQCKVGDIVRFSEIEYPKVSTANGLLLIVNDMDIVGIER